MKHIFLVILLIGAAALAPGLVAADEHDLDDEAEEDDRSVSVRLVEDPEEDPDGEPPEVVDDVTQLLDYSYSDGKMYLTLESNKTQRVTVTDAIDAQQHGHSTPFRVTLQEGTNRVVLPAESENGKAIMNIDTPGRFGFYTVEEHTRPPLVPGPFDKTDAQNSGLAGLVAGISVTGLIAFRKVRGSSDAPERLL